METNTNLEGRYLVAMPGMGDPRFEETLVFMCAHSESGAMGLIVNKPVPDLRFSALVDQLGLDAPTEIPDHSVYYGGPVENGRGFVLHSPDYLLEDTSVEVTDSVALTATVDIIRAIAEGGGPQNHLLALGYAGWAPNQLETEIQSNGWLVLDGADDFVFSGAPDQSWSRAFDVLGVDRRLLSGEAGRA